MPTYDVKWLVKTKQGGDCSYTTGYSSEYSLQDSEEILPDLGTIEDDEEDIIEHSFEKTLNPMKA